MVKRSDTNYHLNIKFGPAGLGPVKDAVSNLEMYSKMGLRACEISFTHGTYINKDNDMLTIGKAAKEFGIKLSIHAQYYINLNSADEEKVIASRKRILKCCEIGEKIGAYSVVFHPGYYGKMDPEITYQNIKKNIVLIMKEMKKEKYEIKIAPETTGKINVFGSLDEISNLVKETGCSFVLDFAHILGKEKKLDWSKIKKLFPQKNWHCHFSGNEIGEKGEIRHRKTTREDFLKILPNLPKDKNIVLINESPYCAEDSVLGLSLS